MGRCQIPAIIAAIAIPSTSIAMSVTINAKMIKLITFNVLFLSQALHPHLDLSEIVLSFATQSRHYATTINFEAILLLRK